MHNKQYNSKFIETRTLEAYQNLFRNLINIRETLNVHKIVKNQTVNRHVKRANCRCANMYKKYSISLRHRTYRRNTVNQTKLYRMP